MSFLSAPLSMIVVDERMLPRDPGTQVEDRAADGRADQLAVRPAHVDPLLQTDVAVSYAITRFLRAEERRDAARCVRACRSVACFGVRSMTVELSSAIAPCAGPTYSSRWNVR